MFLCATSIFYVVSSKGRMVGITDACPPADTGEREGPARYEFRDSGTKLIVGGSGVSEANGVLRSPYHPPGETV